MYCSGSSTVSLQLESVGNGTLRDSSPRKTLLCAASNNGDERGETARDQQRSLGVRGSAALSADLIRWLGTRDATRKSPMSRVEHGGNTRCSTFQASPGSICKNSPFRVQKNGERKERSFRAPSPLAGSSQTVSQYTFTSYPSCIGCNWNSPLAEGHTRAASFDQSDHAISSIG